MLASSQAAYHSLAGRIQKLQMLGQGTLLGLRPAHQDTRAALLYVLRALDEVVQL